MIKKLTLEQKSQIPIYIKKWIDKASEPINREKLPDVVRKLFGEEKIVIIGESLQNTIDLIKMATGGKKLSFQLYSQLDSQLRSQLYSQLYSQLRSQLYSQLRSQLDSQLYSQLRSQLYSQLDSQLGSQLRSQLDSQLYSQLRSQLDSQLDSQLGSQLYSQLYSQLDSQLDSQLYSQLRSQLDNNYSFYCGVFWSVWCGWYDYGKYIGIKFNEQKLQQLFDYQETMPIAIFVGNVIFVCENPVVSWNQQSFIHDTKFPAIRWKDGTGMHFLNGVKFDEELFERVVSKKMSLEEVLKIEDIDQRKQAMRFVNVWDFIKEAKGKKIDTYTKVGKDGRKIRYWLYEFPADSNLFPKGAKYMIYDDSMVGAAEQHMQGVLMQHNTVPEAMAWKQSDDLYELSPKDWELLELDVHFT